MHQVNQKHLLEAMEVFIEICDEKDFEKMYMKVVDTVKNKPEISKLAVEVVHFMQGVNSGRIKKFYYVFETNHFLFGSYQIIFAKNIIEARERMKMVYGAECLEFCMENENYMDIPDESIPEYKLDPIYVLENKI
jgi:hypothetical protein